MNISDYYFNENEKPLDRICDDGGMSAIFQNIACIGDSLSSGELQIKRSVAAYDYFDYFQYSWGQFISRMTGAKVRNFSIGGMSARQYCESFAEERGMWDESKKAQCYIIALGVNDVSHMTTNDIEFGSMDDIKADWHKNGKTFVGYYAEIIQRYKEISPYAKFFLVTCTKDWQREKDNPERAKLYDKHREFLYQLADYFDDTYVIDLRKYAPENDEKYQEVFWLNGHLTPTGYLLTAKMIASYIDYIIRKNPEEFKYIPFIASDNEHRIPTIKKEDLNL